MYKTKLYQTSLGEYYSIIRIADGAQIPSDPDNTDYQAYLKWIEAGNTPKPADE